MILLRAILLSIFIFSISLSESIEITVYSSAFTIDTVLPEIELIEPGHGDVYEHDEIIEISWIGSDQSPSSLPVTIYATPYLNSPYQEIQSNIPNTGTLNLPAPDFINSMFVSIRLDFKDSYGNISSAYSEGYFTIGYPNEDQYIYETESFFEEFTSSAFTIDTKAPTVEWVYPNENSNFNPQQQLVVRWSAEDENLLTNPIDLFFSIDAGNFIYTLEENLVNTGLKFITLPDTTTQLGQFSVKTTDAYGNETIDYSDNYMSIGNIDDSNFEQTSSADTVYSPTFTIDTKIPEFVPISENTYFYPNGGEIFSNYTNVPINFAARDDSESDGSINVYLSYILGGWHIPIAENIPFNNNCNDEDCNIDMSLNGLVESSIWARLIFTATDNYGNTAEQYNNDYFVLGSSEGDLGVNWYNEDSGEILVDWSWEGNKHSVGIRPMSFTNHLISGDKITVVDINGIPTNNCDDDNGYTELKEFTILDNNMISRPKNTLVGINHCQAGGQRRPGYIAGNNIYFKITHTENDSSYLVLPDTTNIGGSYVFDNSHTIVRALNFDNPISVNNIYNNLLENEDRDFDGFSVYNKVNNIQLRNCDTPGTGENNGWCFEETIYGETSYIAQIPNMQQSSNVKYRVWLLDNQGNEVFKTLDTDGINYYVDISDIYDNSLEAGWNWFSLNMSSDDMSISNILSSLSNNATYIKSQSGYSDYYDGFGWLGTIDTFDNLSMYKINLVSSSGNITYQGEIVDPAVTPIPLNQGWNWISYIPQESIDINTALNSISNNATYIKSQSGYADYYDGFGWLGTIETLVPKDGYLINSTNATTLIYPETSGASRYHNYSRAHKPNWDFNNYKSFEYNGTITISIEDIYLQLSEDDQIGAFVNDECRGIAYAYNFPVNEQYVFPMMIYSNSNNEEITFKYYNSKNNKTYDLSNTIIFEQDMIYNDAAQPYIMHRTQPLKFNLDNPYPNPFNPSTTINYTIAENINDLSINIYDIQGRLVKRLFNGSQVYGKHKLIWNASLNSSGIYFIKMNTGNHNFVKKIILIK